LSFRTVPPAITLVRWVNENAFVVEAQTRPCPTFGRPVHLGFPHRLRPGTSPHAFQIPSRDGHPALRSTASSGSSSALAVSSFRLRARLDVCIPSAFFGQRGITPAFGYGAPHLSARGTSTLLDYSLLSTRFAYSAFASLRMVMSRSAQGEDPGRRFRFYRGFAMCACGRRPTTYGMNFERAAPRGVDGLRRFPIERVDFLGARVAKQKR